LLVLARADEDALELRLESLPAGELLERAASRFAARAASAGRSIAVDARGETLDGDPLRLEQAVESRARGGSGLGLSIASVIARAHGGSAGAANREGGGADVWVEVPREAPARQVAGPRSARGRDRGAYA
jgi:signal transduction histidine kinase